MDTKYMLKKWIKELKNGDLEPKDIGLEEFDVDTAVLHLKEEIEELEEGFV